MGTVTTIEQCRHRLEESRRMRLASLDMWPDEPHLELTYTPYPAAGPLNAVTMFVSDFVHNEDHRGQIANIVQQAKQIVGRGS